MEAKIVPVRFPPELIELIEAHRKQRNTRKKGEPITLSGWIRDACREKINHATRSKKKVKTYECCICGFAYPLEQFAWENALLTDAKKKEKVCKKCAYDTKQSTQTPLLDHGTESAPNPAKLG